MEKFEFKQKKSLATKISLILSLILSFATIGIGFLFWDYSINTLNKNNEKKIEEKSIFIESLIKNLEKQGLELASFFSKLPEVQKAYEMEDEKKGSMYLKNKVEPIINTIVKNSEIKILKVHFHKPPARSFLRVWSDKRFDDLSWFRFTILNVYKTKKPIRAIEIGKGGFALRGISPIFDNKRKYIGSVEVFFEPFDVINIIKVDKRKENFLIFIDAKSAENIFFKENINKYFKEKYGSVYFSSSINKNSKPQDVADETIFEKVKQDHSIYTIRKGNLLISYIPLEDFNNKVVGYFVYTVDISGDLKEFYNSLIIIILIFIISILLIIFLLTLLMKKYIFNPLKLFTNKFSLIANGNLDIKVVVKSSDEIGFLYYNLNKTVEKLRTLIEGIISGSNELKNSSFILDKKVKELTQASYNINNSISNTKNVFNDQMASVTETSAAIEQMTRNIENLTELIKTQTSAVNSSSKIVEEMIEGFNEIVEKIDSTSNSVSGLDDISKIGKGKLENVNKIILKISVQSKNLIETNKMIENISSKTNLLAMNAAIEAAHAGEAGKGFAVVADEIRKLAELASEQSKEIGEYLKEIINLVKQAVEFSEESKLSFETMFYKISDLKNVITEINKHMKIQNENSLTISDSLKQLNEITQSVKSGSSEMNIGSQQIIISIKNMVNLNEKTKLELDNIWEELNKIDEIVKEVNNATNQNNNEIKMLNSLTGKFKISNEKNKLSKINGNENIKKMIDHNKNNKNN